MLSIVKLYTPVRTVLYLYFQLSPCVVRLNLATLSMLQTAQTSISSGTIRASHLTMVKECTTVTSWYRDNHVFLLLMMC